MNTPTASPPGAKAKRPARAQIIKDMKLLVNLIQETPRLAAQMVSEQPWLAQEKIPRIEGQNEFCGAQPLSFASSLRRIGVMQALLDVGASPHAMSPEKGRTPLAHALSTDGDDVEPDNREEAAMLLIHNGARLTAIDKLGAGILYDGETDIPPPFFRDLVQSGATLNTYDQSGAHHICNLIDSIDHKAGRRENVLTLIAAGVDLEPRSGPRGHPLYVALSKGECDIVEAMIGQGASLRHKTHVGETLAHRLHIPKILAWVLERDPGLLDEPDFHGKTPLMNRLEAILSGEFGAGNDTLLACAIHLIEAGAELDATDLQGPGVSVSPRQLMAKINLPQAQDMFRALQAQRAARDALADCQPKP